MMGPMYLTHMFLISQLIGFCGSILYFLSFQFKNNRRLFQVQFLSYLFYTVHLLMLGALTGAVSYLINIIRSLCLGSSSEFTHSRKMCALLCAMQLSVLGLTWSGWISLLPIAANIASTVGGYTNSAKKIRIAGMLINSPLWIMYNIIIGSWAGILDELLSELSMIISVFRYGWNSLDDASGT